METIIRTNKREHPYALIDVFALNDQRLSWKAKGLLVYLLSKPNDWKIKEKDLIKRARDGRDAVRSALRELISLGYISRKQVQREDGTFGPVEYTVYERPPLQPQTENPSAENPATENPATENPPITYTDSTYIDNTNRRTEGTPPAAAEIRAAVERYGRKAKINEIGGDPIYATVFSAEIAFTAQKEEAKIWEIKKAFEVWEQRVTEYELRRGQAYRVQCPDRFFADCLRFVRAAGLDNAAET